MGRGGWGFRLMLPGLTCIAAAGCATPVVVHPEAVAVGLFRFEANRPHEAVRYRSLRGWGVAATPGHFAVGYTRRDWVVAELADRSYHVQTPVAEIAAGPAAEAWAPRFVAEQIVTE